MISGKDRGKTGRVLRVDRTKSKVFVEGLNIVKRHQRPQQVPAHSGPRPWAASSRRKARSTSPTSRSSTPRTTSPRAWASPARAVSAVRVRATVETRSWTGSHGPSERALQTTRSARSSWSASATPASCRRREIEKITLNMGVGEAQAGLQASSTPPRSSSRRSPARSRTSARARKSIAELQAARGHAGRRCRSRCAASGCTSSSTAS